MKIVSRSKIDFNSLLSAVLTTTGERIADKVDRMTGAMTDDAKFARCISELTELPHDSPAIEEHLHFSVLVLVEEYDLQTVMSAVNGLAWVGTSTTKRGVLIGLLSGNLPQWRTTVKAGLQSKDITFYENIASLFKAEGFDFSEAQKRLN